MPSSWNDDKHTVTVNHYYFEMCFFRFKNSAIKSELLGCIRVRIKLPNVILPDFILRIFPDLRIIFYSSIIHHRKAFSFSVLAFSPLFRKSAHIF